MSKALISRRKNVVRTESEWDLLKEHTDEIQGNFFGLMSHLLETGRCLIGGIAKELGYLFAGCFSVDPCKSRPTVCEQNYFSTEKPLDFLGSLKRTPI